MTNFGPTVLGPVEGTVKFFKAEKGWGGLTSPEVPADVWVHFSNIEGPGYRALEEGDSVRFTYHAARQDTWKFVALSVVRLEMP